ncbi:uncharacterized protein LOC103361061 isoform X2 [Stegastes partitus]|uniref:Uncharacterized protein LOC103361061 isoform X2 n=1 Tax=Stegastes partitus TaxID=144197 RepID=A0A9Y4K977_9TELE|nr:PREDICTED: uncharacterized protein LOC103361061 isoform X2 [Stegastes partitus]
MGNTHSFVVASLSVCSVYLVYVHIYCAHRLLKTNVLNSDKLPSIVYLYLRYCSRVISRRSGHLNRTAAPRCDPVYTILSCRFENLLLRRFCSAAGYGWDYPDTEYRDVPLCFPEFLCGKLLLMLLTDENFCLNPAGLVRVRQTLKTFEPIDELKKGPFKLQAQVLSYQQTDAGVEVDVCLSATSRSGCPVWENVLTLLSKNRLPKASTHLPKNENKSQPEDPENVKQVELRVPRTVELQCPRSFSDYFPHRLLSLPGRFFSDRSQTSPSLWMLSVCLAEIEKHKGVEVITAPVHISVQFIEPLLVPGKVTIRFWEAAKDAAQSSARSVTFHMEQQGRSISHMVGLISRFTST